MAQAVSIPVDTQDKGEALLDARTLLEWCRQMTLALLQKRPFGGEIPVDAAAVAATYVDVAFTVERLDANYVPRAFIIMADGAESVVRPDMTSRATTGFRVYGVHDLGTLYWWITPYE
jgi:hypothetical protein